MEDYIVRATASGDSIRCFAITSRNLVEAAHEAHGTSNVTTAALGRLLSAGAMMAGMLKSRSDILTLQIGCSGPAGGLTVTGNLDPDSEEDAVAVKGYVNNPQAELPLRADGHLDVGGALGAGILTVIKDMGLKEPFSGQTELISGEIAEDLTYYFASSEQVPSSVGLGVLVAPEGEVLCAGGFIIQLMPFASDEVISALEKRLGEIPSVTKLLAEGLSPEDILERIFGDMDLKITDRIPASFKCNCSKERVRKAVLSIDKKDIEEMIEDGKPVELNCHFCGAHYLFTVDDLKTILSDKNNL